jgi:hypothetical protein
MKVSRAEARPAGKIVLSALALYWRYPFLFLALGALVIVPFDLAVLAASGQGYLQGDRSGIARWCLDVGGWVWIVPLISALHIRAVAAMRLGDEPRLSPVAAAGFRALRRVVPATVISGLLVELFSIPLVLSGVPRTVSLVLFVPTIVLTLRLVVVAQVASMEEVRWLRPLIRSVELTAGEWGHVLAFILLTGLLIAPLVLPFSLALHGHPTTLASFVGGLLIHVLTASFGALATALLYFELVARKREAKSAAVAAPQTA